MDIFAVPNSKRYSIDLDYEVDSTKIIGEGQYSVVKSAKHRKTGEEVAIKFVRREQTEPSELLNEVELMREASGHPGFVKILDVYEDEVNYILVMELVRGGELFDKIAQLTSYSEKRVARLVSQIVSALAFLHSKNIVHRDIKPENLLFVDTEATIIKLCDFGIAEKIPESGYLTEIIGTESYMAPEVELGKQYGVVSDMYGLGIIMYIMLCGYPPFEPENGITVLEYPKEEWADISSSVKELITSLLHYDPAQRPTAEEVARHVWIREDKPNNDNLNATIKTMKMYNEYRASGNFGSMREAKKEPAKFASNGGSSGFSIKKLQNLNQERSRKSSLLTLTKNQSQQSQKK